MASNHKPFFTFIICFITLCGSCYVVYLITGSVVGKSRLPALAEYGGLTIEGIKNFEIWRFLTSQWVHVHQKHMMYNVLSIALLGLILEPRIGFKYMLAIWLIAGTLGTFFSTQFGTPPWNTGTGSSQAALGFAGFALVLFVTKIEQGYVVAGILVFALIPALYLDLKTAGYPKPGHILSLIIGGGIAIVYCLRVNKFGREQ